MDGILWLPTLIGHVGIWCAIFNRTHATAWPRTWRKLIEKGVVLVVAFPVVGLLVALGSGRVESYGAVLSAYPALGVYLLLCVAAAIYFLVAWIRRLQAWRPPHDWVPLDAERIDVQQVLKTRLTHGALARFLSWIPGNQACQVSLETYRIRLAKLPPGFQLKICQLSDFHFTGQIDQAYFRYLVERVNAWRPDLIFITGDLVDEETCLDWIGPVFEPLLAPHGKFYLLGNHDRRMPDEQDLRRRLKDAGLTRAGGCWHQLQINQVSIRLAGNELPWYSGADQLEPFDGGAKELQILLTHSPDQVDWARRFGFDLIFAGHTHGGQIRLPVIGPIISPSKYGVRFAGGAFQIGRAIMHVSRGIGGDEPIRWNCPPEVGLFTVEGPPQADS